MLFFSFSGPNCSSFLRLSIQDRSKPRGVQTVHQFCSPLQLDPFIASSNDERNLPIIVNSSLVFLDFQTAKNQKDFFRGVFRFHNGLYFIIKIHLH